ncbi:MAG: hypothetical protein IJU71_06995 [Selenomonadaceae bacterium]|nr:hypothetical protein [Selenomonadaceae bacterium]
MRNSFAAMLAAMIIFVGGTALAVDVGNDCVIEVESTAYVREGEPLDVTQRSAQLYAYRLLAEHVGELHITSETTIQEAIDSRGFHDEIGARVSTIVRGALIKKTYRDAEGNFHAIATLSMFGGSKSIANAVLPEQTAVEDFPQPRITNIESGNFNGNYTGLIIDCRGMGLDVAIAPSIKSAGGVELYTYKNVTRQMATQRGMVAYSDSTESGAQRAGSNPLVIQAMFVEGECDAVVSDEDADKILAANQAAHFLNNCMVVFVR